jgi:hypothetical protein
VTLSGKISSGLASTWNSSEVRGLGVFSNLDGMLRISGLVIGINRITKVVLWVDFVILEIFMIIIKRLFTYLQFARF